MIFMHAKVRKSLLLSSEAFVYDSVGALEFGELSVEKLPVSPT